ncbi:hypothetical protein AR457_33125 [Streptomyces agglomeratus]|nr:hypothetical protein AR457_33125 [Streptomyces agglomeratus]
MQVGNRFIGGQDRNGRGARRRWACGPSSANGGDGQPYGKVNEGIGEEQCPSGHYALFEHVGFNTNPRGGRG